MSRFYLSNISGVEYTSLDFHICQILYVIVLVLVNLEVLQQVERTNSQTAIL